MEIDAALVTRLIAAQFPQWAHLPVRALDPQGVDNRTFRLGENLLARLPSAEGYALQVEKEHHWLPLLAPQLPLAIPEPQAMGAPGPGYPLHWSVYRWIEGSTATVERIANLPAFAADLAEFLRALQRIDTTGGPPPGPHNFQRGAPLVVYDGDTRRSLAALQGRIDTGAADALWQAAIQTAWQNAPVWLHGDVAAPNLLVNAGRLSAVIDFGCLGVGDPACDLTIAWTFFSGESRAAFRAGLPLDTHTWLRARGWALWKALITLEKHIDADPVKAEKARRIIAEVLNGR